MCISVRVCVCGEARLHGRPDLGLVLADELLHETMQKDRAQTGLPPGQVPTIMPMPSLLPHACYVRVLHAIAQTDVDTYSGC